MGSIPSIGQKENPHPIEGEGESKSFIEEAASRGKWAAFLKKLYKSMQNSQKEQTWISNLFGNPDQKFQDRKAQISKYRSPQTIADEILLILTWGVQPLLLVFCMALSYSSYQSFFSHNFSYPIATAGAVILSLVIELGKIKIGGYVVQIPFLSGIKILKSSFSVFAVWVLALIITILTFTMSVKNSTKGAQMLAKKAGFEKNERIFTPNTQDIDAQILASDARSKAASSIKWKGTVTYQSQQAIKAESKSMALLQEQRQEQINQQRADFERSRAQMDSNTTTGADMLMAAGGWVEALQAVALILIGACMSTIDKVMPNPSPTPTNGQQNGNISYNQLNGQGSQNSHKNTIGYHWVGYGQIPQKSVTHQDKGVTHQAVGNPDDTLLLARKNFSSWAANYADKKHNKANVDTRIAQILDNLLTKINDGSLAPSRTVAIQSYDFFSNKLENLDSIGRPYPNKDALLDSLRSIANQTEPTA